MTTPASCSAAPAHHSLAITRAHAEGDAANLHLSGVQSAPQLVGERRFGMCGRLRPFDVAGAASR
ncbi:hypothetical protein ACFC1I_09250 [Microbacterium sp. NPDC056044]|uniref:hypothetical protein n=1 Tax=Microbacterium sp. NPDC056044 TaxID=3345690 RepID=UPI0035D5AD43